MSSSLLLFPRRFGRYVPRPSSGVCCLNFWDEAWWFLSLGAFGLLSSSLLLFPQRFGRYVPRPSLSVCCLNFWEENGWFLSLRIFRPFSSSLLLLFPQRFGRYDLRPSSGICCLNFWEEAWWFLSLRAIVFIFIVISAKFRSICPLAVNKTHSVTVIGVASKETIIWRLQVQSRLQASNNTGILNTCTRLWLMESEQVTPVDSIMDVVRSSVEVLEFNKHQKKAGGHIVPNVVEITIKIKTIVRKSLII